MTINLYPHQNEFVSKLRDGLHSHDSVLGQAATGYGKTVTGAYIAQRTADNGKTVIFTVHRHNLMHQTALTFEEFDIPFGYIAAGFPYDPDKRVYIASIDTLQRRLDMVPAPDLLVIDEAHMAAARTWSKVVNNYRTKGSMVLGFSATPARLDGKPLADLFGHMVQGPPTRWLMDEGYLSDYVAYAPSTPDLSGVHTRMGDYAKREVEEATDRPKITGDAATHYKKLASGTRAICYCVSIEHSKHVCKHFNDAGIPTAHIDGKTPRHEQQQVIRDFADGHYQVLCNVELITTGFDLGSQVGRDVPVETIICLRPTQSEALHLQMIGRGLRRKNKPAILLDHSGNLLRLGLPDDDREWSLEGRPKRAKADTEATIAIRQCSACYHVHRPAPVCPKCGYVYPVQSREIEQVDGELQQLDPKAMRRTERAQEREAKTYGALFALAQERGYKSPGSFATKRMMGRARSMADLVQLGRDSGKGNPEAWAGFMWRTVLPKIRGRRAA